MDESDDNDDPIEKWAQAVAAERPDRQLARGCYFGVSLGRARLRAHSLHASSTASAIGNCPDEGVAWGGTAEICGVACGGGFGGGGTAEGVACGGGFGGGGGTAEI